MPARLHGFSHFFRVWRGVRGRWGRLGGGRATALLTRLPRTKNGPQKSARVEPFSPGAGCSGCGCARCVWLKRCAPSVPPATTTTTTIPTPSSTGSLFPLPGPPLPHPPTHPHIIRHKAVQRKEPKRLTHATQQKNHFFFFPNATTAGTRSPVSFASRLVAVSLPLVSKRRLRICESGGRCC